MMKLYIVFEDGIHKDEWWYMDTFETQKKAEDFIDEMSDYEADSHYRIVEYNVGKLIKEI